MPTRPGQKRDARVRARITAIKRQITAVDRLCTGTLLRRTKVCGKPGCRCATDPAARHGPYYEWNRYVEGKLRHRVVSAEQAAQIQRALDNYQAILELLAQWEEQSIMLLLDRK